VPYEVAAENAALDGIGAVASWIALHTADPTAAGVAEVAGGSPAYARKQTSWNPAASSAKAGSACVIDIPASTTVSHWSLRSAVTGGNMHYYGPLPNPETYSSQGQYALTPTITASG